MVDARLDVVYEDNHVIVVNKPVNVPSQEDSSCDMDLLSMVKAYIKEKYQKPGDVFIGLIHRLDRPAGGLMVFARTSKAASRLSEQMRSRKITKKYLAVVEGEVPKSFDPIRLECYIEKDTSINKVSIYTVQNGGAKFAALEYVFIQIDQNHQNHQNHKLSLIEVTLETGRPHQIRAQMSYVGLPLYGDQKYGNGFPGQQLALWSHQLSFEHPVSKEHLKFVSVPPLKQEPWKYFSI